MMYHISNWLNKTLHSINWLIQEMDVTQWGIMSVVFVVLGFLALKTRM